MGSAAQGQRRRGAKSPQGEATTGAVEDRRAKKRATDRLAQREHRRRQREYIDELEAQLKLIKEGSHSDSVAALVAENGRLKSELEQLRQFATSVNLAISQLPTVAEAGPPVSSAAPCMDAEQSSPKPGCAGSPSTGNSASPSQTNGTAAGTTNHPNPVPGPPPQPQHCPDAYSGEDDPQRGLLDFNITKEILESPPFIDPLFHQTSEDSPVSHTGVNRTPRANNRTLAEDMNPIDLHPPLLSRSAWERLGQLDYTILPEFRYSKQAPSSEGLDPLLLAHDPLQCHSVDMVQLQEGPSEWASHVLPHKNIPNILFPALREDELLYGLVDRARWQAVITGTKISKPKLVDYVLDTTANQFSIELKQYLEPMRRLRKNEVYFASYWLISTLIRWYVHQEESLYNNVPAWLRPTGLELRIPHPLLISFMPWPLLRNQLILDFHIHRVPIHPIMTDLGEFLELTFSSAAGGLSLGEDQLIQCLMDLSNWRLRSGFFDRHPQFKDAYQQYFV